MPATSEAQLQHLARVNALPRTRANRFRKDQRPWNYGTKMMVDRTCECCGSVFQIAAAQAKRMAHHTGRFCSKRCFYEAKKNLSLRSQIQPLYKEGKTLRQIADILGINRNAVSGQISRMKIADRFGDGIYSKVSSQRARRFLKDYFGVQGCELCGYTRFVELAHVTERKNGGQSTLDNCLLLCPSCHRLFDYNMLADEEKAKLLAIARLNGNLARRLSCQA